MLLPSQVSGLPQRLKAVCIHSNMSKAQREAAVAKVGEEVGPRSSSPPPLSAGLYWDVLVIPTF